MCDYCEGERKSLIAQPSFIEVFLEGDLTIGITDKHDDRYDWFDINYCPMCGRNLKGEQPWQ